MRLRLADIFNCIDGLQRSEVKLVPYVATSSFHIAKLTINN